jgi:hypothetical protein
MKKMNFEIFLDHFSTPEGRKLALARMVERGTVTDPVHAQKAVDFFECEHNHYLAGKLCETISAFLEKQAEKEREQADLSARKGEAKEARVHREHWKRLNRRVPEFFERALANYRREYLFECAGRVLEKKAESILNAALKEREQADLNLSKCIYEQAQHSDSKAAYYRKAAKPHNKEAHKLTVRALKVYEQVIDCYNRAKLSADEDRCRKIFRRNSAELVSRKKNLRAAVRFCRKKQWYSLAQEYARKNKDPQTAEHLSECLRKMMDKYGSTGKLFEKNGKVLMQRSRRLDKKSAVARQKALFHEEMYRKKGGLYHRFMKSYRKWKSKGLQRRVNRLTRQASQHFQKAKVEFLNAEITGKVSEMESYIYSPERRYENFILTFEKTRFTGNAVSLHDILQQSDRLTQEFKNGELDRYVRILTAKKKILERLLHIHREADRMEIKADESDKPKVRDRLFKKAIALYEEGGFFSLAAELSEKIGDRALADTYRHIA